MVGLGAQYPAISPDSVKVAAGLNILVIELLHQGLELNAMEQPRRSVKANVPANYKYPTIDDHAQIALERFKVWLQKKDSSGHL